MYQFAIQARFRPVLGNASVHSLGREPLMFAVEINIELIANSLAETFS
jgi:hypothetical protein